MENSVFKNLGNVNWLSGPIQTPLLKRLKGEKQAILDWYREGAPLQMLGLPACPRLCAIY